MPKFLGYTFTGRLQVTQKILFFFATYCFLFPLFADERGIEDYLSLSAEYAFYNRKGEGTQGIVNDNNELLCDPCSDPAVITARNLAHRFHYRSGYRVLADLLIDRENTIEGIYLWLNAWKAKLTVVDPGALSLPFSDATSTVDYTAADRATARYKSQFQNAELNSWRHFTPRNVDYFSVSGILGARAMFLREYFRVAFTKNQSTSHYKIATKNHLYGLQVGLNLQVNPTDYFTWEITGKIGGCVNDIKAHTFLGDSNDTIILKDTDRHRMHASFLFDISGAIGFLFWRYFNLHAGYQLIYLSHLAFAPRQIDPSTTGQREHIESNGEVAINGLFTGLTVTF